MVEIVSSDMSALKALSQEESKKIGDVIADNCNSKLTMRDETEDVVSK